MPPNPFAPTSNNHQAPNPNQHQHHQLQPLPQQSTTPSMLQPEHIDLLQMFAEEDVGAPREPLWDEGAHPPHPHSLAPPPHYPNNGMGQTQHPPAHGARVRPPPGYGGSMMQHEGQPFPSSGGQSVPLPSLPPSPTSTLLTNQWVEATPLAPPPCSLPWATGTTTTTTTTSLVTLPSSLVTLPSFRGSDR